MRSKGAEVEGSNQTVTKIDVSVKNRMDSFLQTDISHGMGLRSQANIVSRAVTDFLDKYTIEEEPIRFILPSLEDDELRIDVHIFSDKIKCNRCITNQESCKHVDLMYDNKEVKGHLKKAKLIIPKRKK